MVGNDNQQTRIRNINEHWKKKLKGKQTIKNMRHSHIFPNWNLLPTRNHQINLQKKSCASDVAQSFFHSAVAS